jgi:HlyD family secretion protein
MPEAKLPDLLQAPGASRPALATLLMVLAGCGGEEATAPSYETAVVERRDILVAVDAAGTIEPLLTIEIKSKASGEVLRAPGQTGEVVQAGTLLVQIDKRSPRNLLAQADAELEAAIARRAIAKAQNERAKRLFETRTINEVDYEKTQLDYANARADVVRAQVAVENARITMDDTDVRAPITGTIIEKLVEPGQVISSPMRDFGGGNALLKMADLSTVQVRALVDETDVGKIEPGKPVLVRVAAYPNQPFPGTVHKIEPQATADQNVTTFAVLIRLANPDGLLRPGMNADVQIRVAERGNVVAVPSGALRTPREIAVAASAVGLDEATVRGQLGAGLDEGASTGRSGGYQYGGRYWAFVEQAGQPRAVVVDTGLTDLEMNEVLSGLGEGDTVVLLPSTGLLEQQARGREMMRRFSVMPGANRGQGQGSGQGQRQSQGQGQGQGQGGSSRAPQ